MTYKNIDAVMVPLMIAIKRNHPNVFNRIFIPPPAGTTDIQLKVECKKPFNEMAFVSDHTRAKLLGVSFYASQKLAKQNEDGLITTVPKKPAGQASAKKARNTRAFNVSQKPGRVRLMDPALFTIFRQFCAQNAPRSIPEVDGIIREATRPSEGEE